MNDYDLLNDKKERNETYIYIYIYKKKIKLEECITIIGSTYRDKMH